jgi:hypothetical protein
MFLPPTSLGAGAYNPVANGSGLAYFGFARCKRAEAVKWIRSEAVISCDNIGMQPQKSILLNNCTA